jgi:hypothetical protein
MLIRGRLDAGRGFELHETFGLALQHLVVRQSQLGAGDEAGAKRNNDQHQGREHCDKPDAGHIAPAFSLGLSAIGFAAVAASLSR